jgi:dihydrofolate reductase
VTFEQMHGYWPLQTDNTTGTTDYLNNVAKYLVSSTLQDPDWERTTVRRSVDDIGALKFETGGDIVTTGSIRLVRELIAGGLVDEYRLFTYPVVLGRGQRLFADATEVPRLRLVESQPFCSGMYGVGDALPAVYTERFRTQLYNERVVHPGAWNKLVVVAREDDQEAILNHALIQSRRRYRT